MSKADPIADLIDACARGDREAFTGLYRATSAKLFSVALSILKDRSVAEEALHDAFVSVWRGASRFDRARGTGMTWMITVVRNRALTVRRGTVRETAAAPETIAEGLVDPAPRPDHRAEWNSEAQAFLACLDELEEKQKQAILLAYYEGYTHAELAARLGAPLGTVKTWIRRGLIRLKQCMDDDAT